MVQIPVQIPRLRALRLARVLTQEDLSKRAGVSPTTISAVEQGGEGRIVTARKLAEALGIPPEELVKPAKERAS